MKWEGVFIASEDTARAYVAEARAATAGRFISVRVLNGPEGISTYRDGKDFNRHVVAGPDMAARHDDDWAKQREQDVRLAFSDGCVVVSVAVRGLTAARVKKRRDNLAHNVKDRLAKDKGL